jgi:hypothetical protein
MKLKGCVEFKDRGMRLRRISKERRNLKDKNRRMIMISEE